MRVPVDPELNLIHAKLLRLRYTNMPTHLKMAELPALKADVDCWIMLNKHRLYHEGIPLLYQIEELLDQCMKDVVRQKRTEVFLRARV
nr:hypothetical protein [Sicyoidochytrium minutum DNA virus]